MIAETAEPLEVLWVLVALASLLVSLKLTADALALLDAATRERRPEAVRLLAGIRVRNELKRLAIGSLVLFVGWLSAAYPPAQAFPWRTTVQLCWLAIAALNLAASLANERDTRRVIDLVNEDGER